MAQPSAPASWLARETIVSSTVSTSSVELTARLISPRAVSFSTDWVSSPVRASSSLNRRTFSIGDDRLVGEGLEERDLVVGEPAGLAAGHRDRAERAAPSRSIGTTSQASVASGTRDVAPGFRVLGDRSAVSGDDGRRRAIENRR